MHHRHRDIGGLQHPQRIERVELVGHDLGLPHHVADRDTLARDHRGEHLAHLDDAEDRVGRAFRHRKQRMRAVLDRLTDSRLIRVDVDPVEFGARGHHLAHGALCKPDDTGEDLVLLGLDHA